MELIKQIKDAEKQATDIIEKARQDAARVLEEANKQRTDLLRQAEQGRLNAIDEAVDKAEQEGQSQASKIAKAGKEEIDSLRASCSVKIQSCVEKVLTRLQQA
jgi:vacuolar-type H+-ATPase subunit H